MSTSLQVHVPEFNVTVRTLSGEVSRYSVTSWWLDEAHPGVLFIKNANLGWKGAYSPATGWRITSKEEPDGE